jgi:hypothetical protein
MCASRIRSAGPAGGNEAQAGHRWQSEPGQVRYGGAPLRAPRQNLFCNFALPHLAAQRTLVVKISDTSSHGKAGSNPAFDVTYRGSGPARAVASRVPVLLPGRTCVDVIDSQYRLFPSICDFPGAAMRLGKAVAKMSVTSLEAPARFLRLRVAWFKSRRQKCRS